MTPLPVFPRLHAGTLTMAPSVDPAPKDLRATDVFAKGTLAQKTPVMRESAVMTLIHPPSSDVGPAPRGIEGMVLIVYPLLVNRDPHPVSW